MKIFADADLYATAENLGIEPEVIQAVMQKETKTDPWFTSKGKRTLKILYERHVFWRCLVNRGIDPNALLRADPTLRDILSQTPYAPREYGKYTAQYTRRERAMQIDRDSGLMACSYGGLQILGENHADCGFDTVSDFVRAMEESPAEWLKAFSSLVKKMGVVDALKRRDFTTFARAYNGPNFWKRGYDVELSRIYQRILAASLPKPESTLTALAASSTVQRTVATATAGVVPGAGLLLESQSVADLLDTAKALAGKGQEISGQVAELQAQATAVAGQLDWLPWAISGQALLVVSLGAWVIWRYLYDRGHV